MIDTDYVFQDRSKRRTGTKESVPPTPSIVANIRNRETGPETDVYRHLNLSSPDPTPRASLRPGIDPASAVTPVRSAPSASLFRFPLPQGVIDSPKADNFNSPKLKQKSPNLTTQSQDLNFSGRITKGSLGQFSPMLSSTATVSEERLITPTYSDLGNLTSNTPTFSEVVDNTSKMSNFDTTQTKIDMYGLLGEAGQSEEVSSTDAGKTRIIDDAASLDVLDYIDSVKNPNSKHSEQSVSKVKENKEEGETVSDTERIWNVYSLSAITY